MRAQTISACGGPEVFQETEMPIPTVRPGHILIQVKATSVNPVDCKIRSGSLPAIAPDFPAVLHGDVSGIVKEVGSQVNNFKIGDEVYACAGGVKGTGGALAEYMLADAALVAKKPRTLSFLEAAAMPLVTITAWTALFLKAELKSGQTCLVHGGVGGVGHIALQLAKYTGAKVFTTVSSDEDALLAKKLGADETINYKKETVAEYVQRTTGGKGFDVIFDTVGGKNLDLSFQAAALNGRIATTSARGPTDLTLMHAKGLTLSVVFMLLPLLYNQDRAHQGEILEQAAKLVDEGKLKPLIDKQLFTLAEAGKAHAYLESGKATGKVVISI